MRDALLLVALVAIEIASLMAAFSWVLLIPEGHRVGDAFSLGLLLSLIAGVAAPIWIGATLQHSR